MLAGYYRTSLIGFILVAGVVATPAWANTDILHDFNGRVQNIETYTGKNNWLVAIFWASDCQVCNDEAGKYVELYARSKDQNISILGISMDGTAKKPAAEAFIKRHGIKFPNLIGEPGEVSALYTQKTHEVWLGTPMFMIYGPDGALMASQVGAVPVEEIEGFIERYKKKQKRKKREPKNP